MEEDGIPYPQVSSGTPHGPYVPSELPLGPNPPQYEHSGAQLGQLLALGTYMQT
jgi:hypothetical protein